MRAGGGAGAALPASSVERAPVESSEAQPIVFAGTFRGHGGRAAPPPPIICPPAARLPPLMGRSIAAGRAPAANTDFGLWCPTLFKRGGVCSKTRLPRRTAPGRPGHALSHRAPRPARAEAPRARRGHVRAPGPPRARTARALPGPRGGRAAASGPRASVASSRRGPPSRARGRAWAPARLAPAPCPPRPCAALAPLSVPTRFFFHTTSGCGPRPPPRCPARRRRAGRRGRLRAGCPRGGPDPAPHPRPGSQTCLRPHTVTARGAGIPGPSARVGWPAAAATAASARPGRRPLHLTSTASNGSVGRPAPVPAARPQPGIRLAAFPAAAAPPPDPVPTGVVAADRSRARVSIRPGSNPFLSRSSRRAALPPFCPENCWPAPPKQPPPGPPPPPRCDTVEPR
jgi:hypothetical protein